MFRSAVVRETVEDSRLGIVDVFVRRLEDARNGRVFFASIRRNEKIADDLELIRITRCRVVTEIQSTSDNRKISTA